MCGIYGFNWQDKSLIKKINREISHRGPDDFGMFQDKYVSLGHRRLSIIDLTKSGKQPMSNKEGTIWITFNGEIYNYKELRKTLEHQYDFKSNTDTEVLIYLYQEHGTKLLEKLQGMFTFCIYDSRKKILFLARDRAGIKPLYYHNKNKKFIFCSEIKGILKHEETKKEISLDSLSSFLTFRANTQEVTLFKEIKKLMPSHYLIYDLKSQNLQIKKYWSLSKIPGTGKSFSYFKKRLRFLLEDSVKSRLMSDVPYGAYLSGGIDSGTIVSLMQKYSQKKVKTFSVGFEQEEHSEAKEARFLAEKLGTDHHELLINEKSIKHLPSIIYQADEPMSDPTSIPIYLLSRYAKKHSTVILTGEGADEIFAGYPQYKFMKLHKQLIKPAPKVIRKLLINTIGNAPPNLLNKAFKFSSSLGEKGLERFSNFVLSSKPESQYLNQTSIFNQKEQSDILGKNTNLYSKYSQYFESPDLITNCQALDFKEPMVEDLLMKVDKNTMVFSIEGRVPFLDHRIIELASKMPSHYKLSGFTKDKHILREAVKDLIPSQTQNRKKKHFFVPIDSWFKKELFSLKDDLLSEKYLKEQKIFSHDYIKKINNGFQKSKLFYSRQLWSLIVFQIWYKQYIENEKIRI